MGEIESAERIEKAISKVIQEGRVVTGDLGGTANTIEFVEEVISLLR